MQQGVKLQIQITPRSWSKRRKDFRVWIGGAGGHFWWENRRSKIWCYCPFTYKCIFSKIFLTRYSLDFLLVILCQARKRAVAWIQSSLELVCRIGQILGMVCPVLKKRVCCNPAGMGETWDKVERNPIGMWCRRISGQQSERIAIHQIPCISDAWFISLPMWPCFFF